MSASAFSKFSGYVFCFFFFQAEDGIRDYKVTGVQTCALPIYLRICSAVARCGAATRGGANRPVAAAPTSAGRLGMARTTATPGPHQACRAATRDRERGVEGKRVDLGGGRII